MLRIIVLSYFEECVESIKCIGNQAIMKALESLLETFILSLIQWMR